MRQYKYGEVAIRAVTLLLSGVSPTPVHAWHSAAKEQWPDPQSSARKKSCPRGVFLGLCKAGFVVGLTGETKDSLSQSEMDCNETYAVQAVEELLRNEA
jgi:hypothetical protein